jgi:hypothetical protein
MTGQVVQKIDTTANGGATTMSRRLKREGSSGEQYVVLAGFSEKIANTLYYFVFENEEFDRFAQAVLSIRNALAHTAVRRAAPTRWSHKRAPAERARGSRRDRWA